MDFSIIIALLLIALLTTLLVLLRRTRLQLALHRFLTRLHKLWTNPALPQVTLLRVIFDFFWSEIVRKSNRDGTEIVRRRCSEDLVS